MSSQKRNVSKVISEVIPEAMIEPQIEITALRFYPGNGDLGIKPWKEGEVRVLPKSIFDRLTQDMPSGWVIRML